jgi:hypothetical protein
MVLGIDTLTASFRAVDFTQKLYRFSGLECTPLLDDEE